MDKFLCTFKLSKGSKIIGASKLILNLIAAVLVLLGIIFTDTLRKILGKELKVEVTTVPTLINKAIKTGKEWLGKTNSPVAQTKDDEFGFNYYCLAVLLMLFFITYAAFSFVLIIGSINRQRFKVFCFLICDGVFTCFLVYWTFLNAWLIIALTIQVYLMFSVFSYWKELQKIHKVRMEKYDQRKRNERAKQPPKPTPKPIIEPAAETLCDVVLNN